MNSQHSKHIKEGFFRFIHKAHSRGEFNIGKFLVVRKSELGMELFARKGVRESEFLSWAYLMSQCGKGKLFVAKGAKLKMILSVTDTMDPRDIFTAAKPHLTPIGWPHTFLFKYDTHHSKGLVGGTFFTNSRSFVGGLIDHYRHNK